MHFCLGDDQLVFAADLQKRRGGEVTVADLAKAVAENTANRVVISRVKGGQPTPAGILGAPPGIYLLRVQVRSGAVLRWHFMGVDTWRGVLYDNDEDPNRRYVCWAPEDAVPAAADALFKDIGVVSVGGVHALLDKAAPQ